LEAILNLRSLMQVGRAGSIFFSPNM